MTKMTQHINFITVYLSIISKKDIFQFFSSNISKASAKMRIFYYINIFYCYLDLTGGTWNRLFFYFSQNKPPSQRTQNICITIVQRRPNVFDVGPTLYKMLYKYLVFAAMFLGGWWVVSLWVAVSHVQSACLVPDNVTSGQWASAASRMYILLLPTQIKTPLQNPHIRGKTDFEGTG